MINVDQFEARSLCGPWVVKIFWHLAIHSNPCPILKKKQLSANDSIHIERIKSFAFSLKFIMQFARSVYILHCKSGHH